MHAAAQVFAGEHDFAAFRASECQSKSTVRRVLAIEVARETGLIAVSVRANAFLHHMVATWSERSSPWGRATATRTGCARCWPHATARARASRRPHRGCTSQAVEYPGDCGLPSVEASRDARVWLAATSRV
jgi:tRNA pseudouridine38-40 synthase